MNSVTFALALACLVAVSAAYPLEFHHPQEIHHHQEEHQEEEHHEPHPYNFKYSVDDHKTGDQKTHHESNEGGVVKGFYSLKEADGTIREVHYTADKHNGFNAVVKIIGTPVYDEPAHHEPAHHQYEEVQHVHEPAKHYWQ